MNFKKKLIILKFGMIQWAFPRLQNYFPWLAEKWSVSLFFHPPRFPLTKTESNFLDGANHLRLKYKERKVEVYSWGKGAPVLLVHGWAGRSTNFMHFIPRLVEAGYQAVAFDAPAHGLSSGNRSNLMEFMEIILLLEKRFGPWKGCIGHSLGGIAIYALASKGMQSNCVITLGTPSRKDDIFRTFFHRRMKGSTVGAAYLERWTLQHFGFDFDKFFPLHEHPLIKPESLLIIHDVGDKEAQVEEASLLQSGNPGSQAIITTGLGHFAMLKDDEVIGHCIQFIIDKDSF